MQSISVLSIDGDGEGDVDLVRIVEEAEHYFPLEGRNEIKYLGKVSLEHDVKVLVGRQCLGGFKFEKLVEKTRKLMVHLQVESLLLGITLDPVVGTNYFFNGNTFKRIAYLVHDYVTEKLGVVSLFQLSEESSSRVVAHGLGHNRGLCHHEKPVDLMHPELLKFDRLQVDGFCKVCARWLIENDYSK
jgi:hypothetical protein